jgi:hypothetical protein
MNLEYFKTVEPISVVEMCKQLSHLGEKEEDSQQLLRVELLLTSGFSLNGKIIKYQESPSVQHIWLETRNQSETKSSIALINCNQIFGITIIDFDAFLKLKEERKSLRNIGLLELKRVNKKVEEEVNDVLKKKIPIVIEWEALDEKQRMIIHRIVAQIPSVFKSVLVDEMSLSSFNDTIRSIKIVISDTEVTRIEDNAFVICVKNTITNTIINDCKALKEKMESLL